MVSWRRLAALARPWAVWLLLLALPAQAQQADGLQAALQAAMTLHPAVQGKAAEVDASAHAAAAVRSQRLPSVNTQVQQFADTHTHAGSGERASFSASLRVRQPVWAFGRIDSNIARADADTAAGRADLVRVQRQLLEDTATAYVGVLGARERLAVAGANVEAHQVFSQQITRRQQGQLASLADVRLAATRLNQARARVERHRGELEIALNELMALTQVALPAQAPVPSTLLEFDSDMHAVVARALKNSAEIAVKQQAVEQARASFKQTRKASMPTLYLQAEKDFNQPDYIDDSRVSLVLEGNIEGMGLAMRGRTRAARSEQQVAEQDLQHSINEVKRSVQRLVFNRSLQASLIEVQEHSLVELRAVLDSYHRQYVAGTKSWLDVLNFQRELSEQQLQMAQARNDWMLYSLQMAALQGDLDLVAGLNGREPANDD